MASVLSPATNGEQNLRAGFSGYGHCARTGDDAARVFGQAHQLVVRALEGPVRRRILKDGRAAEFVPDFPVFYVRMRLGVGRVVHVASDGGDPVSPSLVGSGAVRVEVDRRITCSLR